MTIDAKSAKHGFRYYISVPLESGHKNHSTGDEAGLEKQVDPRIASKIQELVASGKFYSALHEFAIVC